MTDRAPIYLHELNRALAEALAEDRRVFVMGEDIVDPYGGAFKVTKGLSTRFPDRILSTPISEACIVGMGTGMAMRGLLPVVEIMFGDFITIAADQIINHAAKFRQMYNGQVTVPLVIRTPMGGGRGYGPTHSQCLEKLFLGIPGLKVVAPSLFHDVAPLLKKAILEEPDPVLFIEHKLLYPLELITSDGTLTVETFADDAGFPVGGVRNFDGSRPDLTIISYGGTSLPLSRVLRRMHAEEIRISAFFPSLISAPLAPAVFDSIRRSKRALIIEEGAGGFGWGAELSAQIYEAVGNSLEKPVKRMTARDGIVPAARELEYRSLPQVENIEALVEELLS